MASMYSDKDIIQNIPVAGASAAGVASATVDAAKSKKLDDTGSILVGMAGAGFKTYVEGTMANASSDAAKLQDRFLETNKAASAADELRLSTETDLRKMQDIINNRAADGPPANPEESDAIRVRMVALAKEADRLKAAAEGGMSNGDYVARVQALSKKYTAQFPGYSDKIREIIGAATGLEGADRWAAQQYVRDRFAKPSGNIDKTLSPEHMELKFLEQLASVDKSLDIPTLMQLRATDPARYAEVRKQHMDNAAALSAQSVQKAKLDSKGARTTQEANESTYQWLVNADANLIATTVRMNTGATAESIKKYSEDVIRAGGYEKFAESEAGKASLEMHILRQREAIVKTKQETLSEYDMWAARKNVDAETQKNQRSAIERRFAAQEAQWGDKGFVNDYLTVMSKHRDKTIQEQMTIIQSMKGWADSQGLREFATLYYSGEEGQKQLQEKWPLVYDQFKRNDALVKDAEATLRSMQQPSVKPQIDVAVKTAETNGEPVTKDQVLGNTEAYKTAKQVLVARTDSILNNDQLITSKGIDKVSANIVKSSLAGSVSDGDHATHYRSTSWKKAGENFQKLPSDVQGDIKARVADSTNAAISKVLESKAAIEQKHGVVLQFGVNSAGDIAPVARKPVIAPKGGVVTEATQKAIIAAAAEEQKYQAAYNEFWNANRTKLSNIVHIRAGLTGEQLSAVSTEYAPIINGQAQYKPFFSMEGQLVTQAGYGTRAPAAGAEGDGGTTEPSKKAVIQDWSQPR